MAKVPCDLSTAPTLEGVETKREGQGFYFFDFLAVISQYPVFFKF